jgi:hypothetical protein
VTNNQIVFINDRLHMVAIDLASKGIAYTSFTELNSYYLKWKSIVEAFNEASPKEFNKGKFTGHVSYSYMVLQNEF